MNKWTLVAGVAFLSVLGVCYTLLARQGFPILSRSPEPGTTESMQGDVASEFGSSDAPLDDEGDNTYSVDEDQPEAVKRAEKVPPEKAPVEKTPAEKAPTEKAPIEMIEDDEETGVTMDAGGGGDEDGVIEPATTPKTAAKVKPPVGKK